MPKIIMPGSTDNGSWKLSSKHIKQLQLPILFESAQLSSKFTISNRVIWRWLNLRRGFNFGHIFKRTMFGLSLSHEQKVSLSLENEVKDNILLKNLGVAILKHIIYEISLIFWRCYTNTLIYIYYTLGSPASRYS